MGRPLSHTLLGRGANVSYSRLNVDWTGEVRIGSHLDWTVVAQHYHRAAG